MTEIQQFYQDKTIFLTGATGFVGKLVLEKLLRCCYTVRCIYILIREKRNKSSEQRFEEIFQEPIWDKLKQIHPHFQSKLIIVEGNCLERNLGLSERNLRTLISEVQIVMHCAATVRFNEEISRATQINIRAVMDVVRICKKMHRLQALVHVSTAYSNCNRELIEEKFYQPPMSPYNLLKIVEMSSPEQLQDEKFVSKALLHTFPNTYTFTKNLGEYVVAKEGKGLPIAVVRPSIIAGTYEEPIDGYIDKPFGFSGSVHGIMYGLLRCILGNPQVKTDLVPGDFVANNIIAAGWHVADNLASKNIEIFNCTSSDAKQLCIKDYVDKIVHLSKTTYASPKTFWYPFAFVICNPYLFRIMWFVLHTLPAYVILMVSGENSQKIGLLRLYKRTKKMTTVLGYFMSQQWEFDNRKTKLLFKEMSDADKQMFNFDTKSLDWNKFLCRQIKGIKLYLANDEEISAGDGYARIKLLRFYHFLLMFILSLVLGAVLFRSFVF